MSRISIVIGLPDIKADSKPSLVYLGRSGAEMRAAIEASVFPRHIEIPFATGIPKHNPRAAENAAKLKARQAALAQKETEVATREKALADREAQSSKRK